MRDLGEGSCTSPTPELPHSWCRRAKDELSGVRMMWTQRLKSIGTGLRPGQFSTTAIGEEGDEACGEADDDGMASIPAECHRDTATRASTSLPERVGRLWEKTRYARCFISSLAPGPDARSVESRSQKQFYVLWPLLMCSLSRAIDHGFSYRSAPQFALEL
jgi:hypothetical protein